MEPVIIVVSECVHWSEIDDLQQYNNQPLYGYYGASSDINPTRVYISIEDGIEKIIGNKKNKIEKLILIIHDKELYLNKIQEKVSYKKDGTAVVNQYNEKANKLITNYVNLLNKKANEWEVWAFQHGSSSEIYECLEKKYGENIYQSLLEKGLKKNLIKLFTLLKHRIAHLWLPLDIDIQGIVECWNDGRKDAACKYLEDVLEDKKDKKKDQNNNPTYAYYRQKLADLQYIVTGLEFGIQDSDLNDPCSKDAKPVDCSEEVKEFMNGKESVLELIEKVKKEKNENEIEELKQTLLALAGLKTNNEPQGTKHEPNLNSPILKFMCLMDCKIKEKRYNNVEEILNFFQHHKFLDEKGNEMQFCMGNIEIPIESFHDWFYVLDNCLENFRMKL